MEKTKLVEKKYLVTFILITTLFALWGFANDILMGFYCDVDGDTEIHMDDQELKQAGWVEREQIQLQPDNFSLTNKMMEKFKNGEI